MYSSCTFTVDHCTFTGNKASQGGAIYADRCYFTVNDCTFEGNLAATSFGAIYAESCDLTVHDCTFEGNLASVNAGGIYLSGGSSSLTISGATVTGMPIDDNAYVRTDNRYIITIGAGGLSAGACVNVATAMYDAAGTAIATTAGGGNVTADDFAAFHYLGNCYEIT